MVAPIKTNIIHIQFQVYHNIMIATWTLQHVTSLCLVDGQIGMWPVDGQIGMWPLNEKYQGRNLVSRKLTLSCMTSLSMM